MVAFYNQGDQDIYNSGSKFVPQEKYRLGYTPTVNEQKVEQTFGIPNTNAFTNSGGNDFSVYNPDPNSIVNKNYNPYLSRNAAENSYLPGRSNATDQVFNPKQLGGAQMPDELGVSTNTVPLGNNRISSSQLGINLPGGQVQNAYTRARNAMGARGDDTMSRDYPEFTAKEVARLTNNNIQDYRQNYGANTQYEKDNYYDTVDSPFARSQTQLDKFKDNYPDYFAPKPLEGIPGMIQKYAQNNMFSKALGFAENMLPTNRRGILENELSGQGVMVNNIGQIVQGDGAYDTAGNVMAGYNANKLTAESFDKRIAMAKEKMSAENKGARIKALEEAKANFLKAQGKTDLVFEDKEAEKKKKKKKGNIITRFLNKKKETKAAADTQAAAAAAAATGGGSYDAPGGVTDSNYDQAANIRGGGGGNTPNAQGQTAREATYDGNKDTGTAQGYSQHYARGGRAGYFFGGRVNFKDGGLASIL